MPSRDARDAWSGKQVGTALALSIVGLLFGAAVLLHHHQTKRLGPRFGRIDFDSEMWKSAPLYGTDETRLRMLDSLLRHHQLVGMAVDEEQALLGPPSDPAYRAGSDHVYWLGPDPRFLGIDSVWLRVWVKQGVVYRFEISTD